MATKRRARKNAKQIESNGDSGRSQPSAVLQLSPAAIAVRAYDLFLARGGTHGDDLADWLQAEAELRREAANKAAKKVDG